MIVILLLGNANSGKTTTLNILHSKLSSFNIKPYSIKYVGNLLQHDFEEHIEHKNKHIIIYTMGDYIEIIEKKISEYKNNENDILICSCNDSFIEKINKILPDQNYIIKKTIGTSFISNYEANYLDSLILLKIVEEIINIRET